MNNSSNPTNILRPIFLTTFLASCLLIAGCGSAPTKDAKGRLRVEASFYPLQWMAERVGGSHIVVDSLTKPGAEPHDLELTPKDVAAVQDADMIVYLSGFQPAVDEAIRDTQGPGVFDAKPAAHTDLTFTPIEGGKAQTDAAGSVDPHFWQDPTRLAAVADAFAQALEKRDPSHAAAYRRNAARLVADLTKLDHEFSSALTGCTHKDLITSHNAFGYLARRYGLRQVGITGLTPDQEPSPTNLAQVTDFVKAHHVHTVYFETLVSPDLAKTVAREARVKTDVLDPIEGLNAKSQGHDYLQVMHSNLANIKRDQPCGS